MAALPEVKSCSCKDCERCSSSMRFIEPLSVKIKVSVTSSGPTGKDVAAELARLGPKRSINHLLYEEEQQMVVHDSGAVVILLPQAEDLDVDGQHGLWRCDEKDKKMRRAIRNAWTVAGQFSPTVVP